MTLGQSIAAGLGDVSTITTSNLEGLLRRCLAEPRDLGSDLNAPGSYPYGRKCIHRAHDVEVLLMNWKGFMECAPHDHGRSKGWVYIVEGRLNNTFLNYSEEHKRLSINWDSSVSFGAGEILEAPADCIHMMKADGPRLITLHVYTPPIERMRVYDVDKCRTCVVADDCGAWWPEKTQIISSIATFNLV